MVISPSSLGRDLLLVAVYNTAIGLFLTLLTRHDLATNLSYAQAIGFSIYGLIRGQSLWRGRRGIEWRDGLIGIPGGFALGFMLATWLNGLSLADVLAWGDKSVWVAGATALMFGALGTWHFRDEARLREAQAEAAAERAQRIEQEALAARTQLALLQAQIEPHFLFNTLSNVIGLIDHNAPAAQQMLIDLTALLRTSLSRTRKPIVTLGEELDLLRAYLGIMAVRMGPRLAWRIDAAPETLTAQLPPLLVQPLIENAIRHGLEKKTGGGHVAVRCRCDGDMLVIEVADDGIGLPGNLTEGTGLANVRQRLAATCGPRAALTLATPADGGFTARLSLPCRHHEPATADC